MPKIKIFSYLNYIFRNWKSLMNFSGEHVFNVARTQLWAYLMDPEVLAKITPGGKSELEALGGDKYKTKTDIKLGPVKGSFDGKLNLVDKKEPDSFGIQMEQLSKIGNAQAEMKLRLEEVSANETKLSFDADAKLSGVIARTGLTVGILVSPEILDESYGLFKKEK